MQGLTVSGGKDPSFSTSAVYMCFPVPSKNLPHPATNNVSPESGHEFQVSELPSNLKYQTVQQSIKLWKKREENDQSVHY